MVHSGIGESLKSSMDSDCASSSVDVVSMADSITLLVGPREAVGSGACNGDGE